MIQDQPSRTAQRVAQRRAAHQLWDNPRIFDDAIALKIIPRDVAVELSGSRASDSAPARGLRAFVAARSRFAEDHLGEERSRGVRQYVVLGAGLDTFAYRNPYPDLRVFEVDFPATQAWKRKCLEAGGIMLPETLTFAPVDFERDTLAHGLSSAGFKLSEPAFFSWLGVVPYLARQTVLGTLRWIASGPKNGVVFDYAVPRDTLSFFNRMAFDALASRVAAAGEPFVTFFDPEELARALQQMSFARIEDLNSEQINARYFAGRADQLRVRGSLGRLLCAKGKD
jgi:methyltransferase (TIGR00027 family)